MIFENLFRKSTGQENKAEVEQPGVPYLDKPKTFEVVHGVPHPSETEDGREVSAERVAVADVSKKAYDTLHGTMREGGEGRLAEGHSYTESEEDGRQIRIATQKNPDGTVRKLVGVEDLPQERAEGDSPEIVAFRDEVKHPDGTETVHAWDVGGDVVQKVKEGDVTPLSAEEIAAHKTTLNEIGQTRDDK